jgi:hypothetical protein
MENVDVIYGIIAFLWIFDVFYGSFVRIFIAIWYIFSPFGMPCQEKFGNPDYDRRKVGSKNYKKSSYSVADTKMDYVKRAIDLKSH